MDFRRPLFCVLVLICAGIEVASRPAAAAAPAWGEFKSEHFILDTDATDQSAAAAMATLERLRAADLLVLAGEQVEFEGHIRVIVPASRGVFLEIAGDWTAAFYTRGPYADPVVLAPIDVFTNDPETVAHELAHAISFYVFPEQRHWFTEGLAEFVQTLAARQGQANTAALGSHIVRGGISGGGMVGGVPAGYAYFLRDTSVDVPAAQLLAWNGVEDPATPGRFHASSWVLYHWLWNERSKALAAFQRQLSDGVGWNEAWLSSFPDLNPANPEQMHALDAALLDYRRRGRFVMGKIDAKAEVKTTEQPVSAADMRLWLLRLRQQWPQKKEEKLSIERTQLEKARLEDPKNPAVLLALASLDGKIKPEAARAAAEGAPQDFRGWFTLGNVSADPKEKEAALRKAVALGKECPACNNNLAWELLQSGRAKEALPFANRALDLAPWSSAAVDTLAEIALQLGQCPQALQLQRRAAGMQANDGHPKDKVEARLNNVQQRCAGK
jgi:hypothetical protein